MNLKVLAYTSILIIGSAPSLSAQKKFSFERESLLPKDVKEFMLPAQIKQIGVNDTYKFVGTQNTVDVLPEQMSLGKGNGINTMSDSPNYTIEVYYNKKPVFNRFFDYQQAKYTGDPHAGVCIRTEYSMGIACRIKDETGKTLVHFTVIDSSEVNKNYIGCDNTTKKITFEAKDNALKWGTEESAGKYFAEHESTIRSLARNKITFNAGRTLAQTVQLFLVGDLFKKMQYTTISEKLAASYPTEASLSQEAKELYSKWLQNINSGENNAQLVDLAERFAKLPTDEKKQDYKYLCLYQCCFGSCYGARFGKSTAIWYLSRKERP